MSEDRDRTGNMEIEPLADDELEGVAGGTGTLGAGIPPAESSAGATCCSCWQCSSGEPPD